MTRNAQIAFENAMGAVLAGSVILFLAFFLFLFANGPGGGSAGGFLGFCGSVAVFLFVPAAWISGLLWGGQVTFWRGLLVFWPYSVLVSWAVIVSCRKFAAKWRES